MQPLVGFLAHPWSTHLVQVHFSSHVLHTLINMSAVEFCMEGDVG